MLEALMYTKSAAGLVKSYPPPYFINNYNAEYQVKPHYEAL